MKSILCPLCLKSDLLEVYYTTHLILVPFYVCPRCHRSFGSDNWYTGSHTCKNVYMGTKNYMLRIFETKDNMKRAIRCQVPYPSEKFFNRYAGYGDEYAPWL